MYLSLDISNQTLHAVESRWNGKVLEIVKAYSYTPEDQCLTDGQISHRDRMIGALQSLFSLMATKTRKTIVTINGSFIMTRDLDLPAVDSKKLSNMVRYEMNGTAGIVRDLLTEYITLASYINDSGEKMVKVRASAVPRDTVQLFHSVIGDAGLNPSIMDIHSNAIRKVLEMGSINDLSLDGRISLFADLGENNTNLYVAEGKTIVVSRMLPVGHQSLQRAARNIGGDMLPSSYENVDFDSGMMQADVPVPGSIAELGSEYLSNLNEAIQRTIQFAATKMNNRRADTVFVYNTGTLYPNIVKKMAEYTGLDIVPIKKIGSVTAPQDLNLTPYINALGAAIRLK